MKKYRIYLKARVTQVIELYAESEDQAKKYGERLLGVDLDHLDTDDPELNKLVLYYTSDEQPDDWELEDVWELEDGEEFA